ncbi:MAG: glycosyltransferase family 2 protein [Chloroflexi bacterium]|nr:glycosyltransferase family 2 protein [Chloroflexota bacterium]
MKSNYSVSVIVPVYNEIALLASALRRIDSFLADRFADYELLVIESGSTDGTAALCDELAPTLPRLRVIHEGAKNGYGSAVKLGYRTAGKDLVWVITADLPFPLEAIERALPLLAENACVLSFRSKDSRPPFRKIQSFFYNLLVRTFLDLRIRHVNSAFRVFKRDLIQSLRLRSDGWFIDAEVLYRLREQKTHFAEIPVELMERTAGHSTIGLLTPVQLIYDMLVFLQSDKA